MCNRSKQIILGLLANKQILEDKLNEYMIKEKKMEAELRMCKSRERKFENKVKEMEIQLHLLKKKLRWTFIALKILISFFVCLFVYISD